MSSSPRDENTGELVPQPAQIDEVAPPDTAASIVGSTLGRYRITSLLGKGGMGIVYLAEDEALRREVALKVISPDASEDSDRRRRLLREAQAAAAVSHPNIAAVYDVGEANGLLYIAMERVRGETLRERMDRARLSLDEALRVAHRMLEGLATAHEAGIIHRDLKPDNVMVDEAGNVKILDFGLAKFIDNERQSVPAGPTLTVVGQFLGTPSYMSPEQAAGLSVNTRSDVFSFGIVLYEMITGELPFRGSNVLKILAAIERDEPAPASQKNAEIPPHVERVMMRCLKKEPGDRYVNAREVLLAFENEKKADREPPTSPPPRRRPKRLWFVALAALLFSAGIASWVWRSKATSPGAATSASTTAAAAPAPTLVTALPPSKTENAAALAAYREGLQALRDSAWPVADAAFRQAATLDPTFASAHLRVALTALQGAVIPEEGRAAFRKAVSLRTDLSERDRRLLDTLALIYQRDPADMLGVEKKLKEAAEHDPLDIEFLYMAHSFFLAPSISPTKRLQAAERCLAFDPQYADCLQLKGWTLERLGRIDDAIAVYDHCVAVSPAGSDCLVEKMMLHMRAGHCAAMEETTRRVLTSEPNPRWQRTLAVALLARGEDFKVVRGVMEQLWEKSPEAQRAQIRDGDELQFALLQGRMDEAERRLLEWRKRREKSTLETSQAVLARGLISFYELMNRPKEAAEAADRYLSGRPAWTKGLFYDGLYADETLFFMKRKVDGGLASRESFVAERTRWIARWEPELDEEMKPLAWLRAYVELVSTSEDAQEALALMPAQFKFVEFYGGNVAQGRDAMGKMYLLAGRPADAIPHLERVAKDCSTLLQPIPTTLSHYYLGMAREATGDKQGACASYRVVLDRWGQAKPRVPAAEDARARAKALGCNPR